MDNKQEILIIDNLYRVHLKEELSEKIGIMDRNNQSFKVGILNDSIAIGVEIPDECFYSYDTKLSDLGMIHLDVYAKTALGVESNQKIFIKEIVESKYMTIQRYMDSIEDLIILIKADELGRVYIPNPVLKNIYPNQLDNLYIQITSIEDKNYITISAEGDEKHLRKVNKEINLVDITNELKALHINYPCVMKLKTVNNIILITKA